MLVKDFYDGTYDAKMATMRILFQIIGSIFGVAIVFLTTNFDKVVVICPPIDLTDSSIVPCFLDEFFFGKYFLVEFIGTFIYTSVILSLKYDKIYSE